MEPVKAIRPARLFRESRTTEHLENKLDLEQGKLHRWSRKLSRAKFMAAQAKARINSLEKQIERKVRR